MFRRFFGFGSAEPAKPAEKTAENDNWIVNDTLQRYEVKTSGYNYRSIPEIIDANSRSYNDFYINKAVELSDIVNIDLKGANLMIDGNLTVRKEITITNGSIDLMYGTGTTGREHELKMDHDFTFTNGVFKNVYAVRHFLDYSDDNMLGTLADIHGLSTINGISAAEIIAVHGNPSLLRESLKTGNRSSQGTTIIKDLDYNYELILVQDSADLQNVHIYGDTIQMSTEDAAPKIISSTNNATISCNNLQFLSKMSIQGVEIHANKITFASNLDLTNVGIVDCTIYNKLLLTADTIKVFKGNTVFVEGFCVQVEDNKTVEIGMKMYNKGDMNGKNKAIENFATVNGGSINIVRKTLHDDFERVYHSTSEYIVEVLKEGEKYTADTYVNYDVYIQWLTECVTKYGSFSIQKYKIGNTVKEERKTINEFVNMLKTKTRVEKVEILTLSYYPTFKYIHTVPADSNSYVVTNSYEFYSNIEDYDSIVFYSKYRMGESGNYKYQPEVQYTIEEIRSLYKLRKVIIYDVANAIYYYDNDSSFVLKDFLKECEVLAKCKIYLSLSNETATNDILGKSTSWVDIDTWCNSNLQFLYTAEDYSSSSTSKWWCKLLYKKTNGVQSVFDVFPMRPDLINVSNYVDIMAQMLSFDSSYMRKWTNSSIDYTLFFRNEENLLMDYLNVRSCRPLAKVSDELIRYHTLYKNSRYYWNIAVSDNQQSNGFQATYYDLLKHGEFEDPTATLKAMLNSAYMSTYLLNIIKDQWSLFGYENGVIYRVEFEDGSQKSLMELDFVGSENPVTNVMTERTASQLQVPLHTQRIGENSYSSYFTEQIWKDTLSNNTNNEWFSKTDEEFISAINTLLNKKWDSSESIAGASEDNVVTITNSVLVEITQYLVETQFYARKKLYLKNRSTGEYKCIDNIENKDELLNCMIADKDETPKNSLYPPMLNEPKLVEETSIPLHNKVFSMKITSAQDEPTLDVQVNTLDPRVEVKIEGEGTFSEENPWFKELSTYNMTYSGEVGGGILADIERWKEGPEDAKWRREYMAELLYFAQQPILFSTASTGGGSICDPFRLPVNAASPNVILPLDYVCDGLYEIRPAESPEQPTIKYVKSISNYFFDNKYVFSLACHPESAVSPTYAKEAFNRCLTKYLENAKLDSSDEIEVPNDRPLNEFPQYKKGVINSDILVKVTMQRSSDATTEVEFPFGDREISLREHFDTLFDDIHSYYVARFQEAARCEFNPNTARVVPYHPLETLHSNLDPYESVQDENTGATIKTIEEVAKEDYVKVYEMTDNRNEALQWLKECEWKLPGQYKAYIIEKGIQMENEIEFWKFIPVELAISSNNLIVPKDREHPEESILIVDRYFLAKLERDRLECFEDDPEDIENPNIDPVKEKAMMNSQIRYIFQFCRNDFLEMAKQLLLFYCVKDGKIYRDIKLTFNKQETLVIIRKGIKTVKLTEETQSISLLELIVAIESGSEDISYNTITLPSEESGDIAEFTAAANDYVYPPFIVADETYKTDGNLDSEKCIVNVLRGYKELSTLFVNDDKYKYGLEDNKYRYVQRDVLVEISKILEDCNKNKIGSEAGKTKEFKGPISVVGLSREDDPLHQIVTVGIEKQMNFFVNEGAGVMSIYEVSVDDSLSISIIKRVMTDNGVTMQDLANSGLGISTAVVAEALRILKYTDGSWDIRYSDGQEEPVQKSVSDFINESEEDTSVFLPILLVRRKEGVQLPLVTDEAMEDVVAYLKAKRQEYGDDTEFRKYLNDFLLELKQKENELGNYFYFMIETLPPSGILSLDFIPRCQILTMPNRIDRIDDWSFHTVAYPQNVAHLSGSENDLIEKCMIEYTTTKGETPKTYSFWPMDFISYAAVLNEATLELSEINNNNFVYFTTENLVGVAQEMEGVSVFLRRGIDNPDVVNDLRTEAANGAIEYFVYWENEDEEVYSAVKELKEKIERFMSGNITADSLKLYLYEWQLKCAYLSYDEQTGIVEKTQSVALTPVTFKLVKPEQNHGAEVGELEYDTIDTLLGANETELRDTLTNHTEVLPTEYRIHRDNDTEGGDIIPPGPNPDDGGEDVPDDDNKDMYVLSDEDQNETRGWIYTGLIKRLLEKYFNGSLMGDETSWANITNRTMMSNEEMSNIMTLLNTRYQSEIKKANSDEKYDELKEILLPEGEGDEIGVADLINTILTREQDFNRDKVRYSLEERNELMQVIEDWYNYYKPNIKTFIDEAEIMIWEGMDLEYYTKVDTFEERVDDIVRDYNYIYNKVNNTKVTWKKVKPTNLEVYFCVCDFTDPRNTEWPQFMNEIEALRNSWERYSDTNGKILVCIGNNYGEVWSVFGKQPGNNIPIETYFYLKSQTNGCARQLRRCMHPPPEPEPEPEPTESADRRIIYIPKDRADSNINWNFDDYYITKLYQLLFDPFYLTINDSSNFKDFVNPIADAKIYLGYVVIAP